MPEFIVDRASKLSYKFNGELIGEYDTKSGSNRKPAGDSTMYVVKRLYKTDSGKLIGESFEVNRATGLQVRNKAVIFSEPSEMFKFYNSSSVARDFMVKAGIQAYEVVG